MYRGSVPAQEQRRFGTALPRGQKQRGEFEILRGRDLEVHRVARCGSDIDAHFVHEHRLIGGRLRERGCQFEALEQVLTSEQLGSTDTYQRFPVDRFFKYFTCQSAMVSPIIATPAGTEARIDDVIVL